MLLVGCILVKCGINRTFLLEFFLKVDSLFCQMTEAIAANKYEHL